MPPLPGLKSKFPTVLICPNAFKGTLLPTPAAQEMAAAFHSYRRHLQTRVCPLADGGDGTLDVLLNALGGRLIQTRVRGPLGKPVWAPWGFVASGPHRPKTAIIEMARASGLALLKGKNRILQATSFGTGQLLRAALNKGCRHIYLGVGGTATSDGGAGALQALGLRYWDKKKRRLSAEPRDLIHLDRVETAGLDSRLLKTKITVLCDVDNPLLGPRGSARTFGPQKGATPAQVAFLEKCLKRWSGFAPRRAQKKPGAGAAGAVAFGLAGFAGARLVPGAPTIMKAVGWFSQAQKAHVLLTGEGRLDKTSFSGKVVGEVLRQKKGKPVWVVCGSSSLKDAALRRKGVIHSVQMGSQGRRSPKKALKRAIQRLLKEAKFSLPSLLLLL